MSTYLTPTELRDWCGRKHKAHQVEWLASRRVPFEQDADGCPKVLRSEFDRRMRTPTRAPWVPNFTGFEV